MKNVAKGIFKKLPVPALKRSDRSAEFAPIEGRDLTGTLVARGLTKVYGGRRVVDGASMAVRTGEAVGLLGPNGAGKTTSFYMVTGLVPVDAGQILLDGNDVTTMPMYQRARLGIGYLPQEASIFRGLSVEKNIMAVLEVVEKSSKERDRRLDALLEPLDEIEFARDQETSASRRVRRLSLALVKSTQNAATPGIKSWSPVCARIGHGKEVPANTGLSTSKRPPAAARHWWVSR